MENKVVHEIRLSKPVMTVAVIAAVGLLAIGAKPLIEATPAFASSDVVHKIAICGTDKNPRKDKTNNADFSGEYRCASVNDNYHFEIQN